MLRKLMPAARVKVLSFLLLNASESFHMREIARRSSVPLKSVQRELDLLEAITLIEREKRGRQVFVKVQTSHPLFGDLRSLFLKTEGLADPLRRELEKIGRVDAAAVYGSVASGTDTGASDIDLLVVGAPEALALHDIVSFLEDRLGRPINYTLMTSEEFGDRRRSNEPFLGRILSGDLIPLIGNLHGD